MLIDGVTLCRGEIALHGQIHTDGIGYINDVEIILLSVGKAQNPVPLHESILITLKMLLVWFVFIITLLLQKPILLTYCISI